MAELNDRLTQNTPGNFYVDDSCTDCDMCRSIAPNFFKRDNEIGLSFVHRQPTSADDIELAQEAVESCPSDSIGNDGEARK